MSQENKISQKEERKNEKGRKEEKKYKEKEKSFTRAKTQEEEEETNETNSRKRVSSESPDCLIQSSHCLCCLGQGGKPICVLWYCLGYKCHGRFPIHSSVYVHAPLLTTKTRAEETCPEQSEGWKRRMMHFGAE